MTMKSVAIMVVACVIAVAASASKVRADDVNGAAKAFGQAQEATLAGDPARAADLYELADELAPSAPALRNAARARLAAGHEAMAATLAAEMLRRYPNDKESRDVAEAILSKLTGKLAQLDITCDEPCTISLDGKAASGRPRTQHTFFAQPGARNIGASFDGNRQASKQVTALVAQSTTITLEAPARTQPADAATTTPPSRGASQPGLSSHDATPPAASSRGLSKTWFIVAAIGTVALGGLATYEGMQTLDTRDQIRAATAAGDSAHAKQLYDDGRTQQLTTNLLIGGAAAAGVATLVLGIVTDWSSRGEHRDTSPVAVTPLTGGAAITLQGHL